MAAITPAAGVVGPLGALAIGFSAGLLCYLASTAMKRKFGYDDSLDVFGVHGVGGFLGTVMAGIFGAAILGGNQEGLDIVSQVGVQIFAATVTALWAGIASFALLKLVDVLVGLRVSEEDESLGLDVALHEESGYNL